MTDAAGMLVAEFASADRLLAAIPRVRAAGYTRLDAFAPLAVEGLHEALGGRPSRAGLAMLAAGVLAAAGSYGLEWLSAVRLYPLNVGGRPLHSWQVFTLVPFEVGVLAAALAGFAAFLWSSGLPSLHHPLFAVEGFERASRDRFILAVGDLRSTAERDEVRTLLEGQGALSVREAAP
jgi:hypothetical protein